ncbi:MAG: transporter substrate-binding domain-containing protein [Saprospiraceae bacterium]|nr:transporter substrate-binding domain-containing protein [Saprospiraceae bacterium]
MNKIIFVFSISLMLFSSCREGRTDNTHQFNNKLDRITGSNTLRVGYLEWAPCVVKDKRTNEMSGIFIDMVNQISMSLNDSMKIEWVETSLANFRTDLKTDKFDFCVGPTFINIPRSSAVDFSKPICYVGNSGVVLKGNSSKYNSLEKLNSENVRIAVLQGQAMEAFCNTYIPKAKIVSIQGKDLTSPLQAVISNRADIGFMNVVTTSGFALEHPEIEVVEINENKLEVLPLSWTTLHSDISLMNFLNSSISYLSITGKIQEFQSKYDIKLLYDNIELIKG